MKQLEKMISIEGAQATFTPSDDLTASTVSELRDAIKHLIAEGTRELVVDLSNVKVVDSSGIGLLVAAHNSLSRLEGKLLVINVSSNLIDLFRAFRLEKHFTISAK
jgi:anti-anti-sigma factor